MQYLIWNGQIVIEKNIQIVYYIICDEDVMNISTEILLMAEISKKQKILSVDLKCPKIVISCPQTDIINMIHLFIVV